MVLREIIFRGKTDKGEWVQGDLLIKGFDYETAIRKLYEENNMLHGSIIKVIPETIGQYTGLTDKSGTKIFEGDIVHCWGSEYAFGFWEHNNTFAFTDISNYMQMGELSESEFIKVIGNIHDNPELLKELGK